MGANSSIRSYHESFLTKISTDNALYQDKSFWKNLFETLSPYLSIPDLSQILINQPDNLTHVTQLSIEYLESAWLQVEELSSNLIRSSENSLNFLAHIIPLTVEHQSLDFFWDSNMRAYRGLKAAMGLYTSLFFGSSSRQAQTIQNYSPHNVSENSQICNKRREMILRLLNSCFSKITYGFKHLISREIIVTEEFIVALLESLTEKSVELVSLTSKFLSYMLESEEEPDTIGQDSLFIEELLKQRKKNNTNYFRSFFNTLSDENINKVLFSIVISGTNLECLEKMQNVIELLSNLYSLNELYCRYTAINNNISVVSSIITTCPVLPVRPSSKYFAKAFYKLSCYREFSVSLTSAEMNTMLEFVFKVILLNQYEFQDLFPYLFCIFHNTSPFIIELSPSVSQQIVSAYEYLLDKTWLLSKKQHHLNIFYIIEGINNLIQYQWEGCCSLIYQIVKKKESFYRVIRMQVDTPDEVNMDDKATDGEFEEEESLPSEESSQSEEEKAESSGSEVFSEEDDRVVELERISEGLILGLNAHGPDELVQRTSYLNTIVSSAEEDAERRNTVQHIEVKQEEWKPTPEWMLVWKTKLPMKCIFVLVKEVFSVVVDLQEKGKKAEAIVEEIQKMTLVGLLPRPHSINLVLNL